MVSLLHIVGKRATPPGTRDVIVEENIHKVTSDFRGKPSIQLVGFVHKGDEGVSAVDLHSDGVVGDKEN